MITTAWWKYNPITQKPAALEPLAPIGLYYYYGPDPAAGVSYGSYEDEDAGCYFISKASSAIFSPATGKKLKPSDDLNVKNIMSKMLSKSVAMSSYKCEGCGEKVHSSVDLGSIPQVFCWNCGGKIDVSTTNKGDKKTMASSKTLNHIKEIKARLQNKALAADEEKEMKEPEAMEPMADEAPAPEAKEEKEAPLESMEAEKPKEEAKEPLNEDDYIPLETILEEVNKAESKLKIEAARQRIATKKAEAEDKLSAIKEKIENLKNEGDEMDKEMDKELDLEKAKADEGGSLEEKAEEGESLEEKAESAEEEEKLNMDIVLSMLKKKAEANKQAKIKAIREKIKAKSVKAEDEEKKEEKKEEKAEDEGKKEEKAKAEEKADPEKLAPELKEGADFMEEDLKNLDPKANAPADMFGNPSEAMRYEPIASMDSLANVDKGDICMDLIGEHTDNPTWSVAVKGVPAARIQLKSQASAEDIRDAFCDDGFALSLIDHCSVEGFVPAMKKVNAEFWANYTSNKAVSAKYKAAAEELIKEEKRKILASFKNEFISAMRVVTAGMNKNFYPALGNALKDSLFENLKTMGLPEVTAKTVIEKSFAEGAAEYFDVLFEKANEHMNLPKEAKAEISKAISASDTLDHSATEEIESYEPATLKQRVSQASIAAQLGGGNGFYNVQNSVTLDTDEYKRMLKSVANFRK